MTRLRSATLVLLLAGLLGTPLSPASAHRHGPFFLWPFAAAAAVVGTAAAIATAPLAVIAPQPAYYPPPAPAYYPSPAYYAPPPGYYPGYYYGR